MVEVPQYTANQRAARPNKTAAVAPSMSTTQSNLAVVGNQLDAMATQTMEYEAVAQAKDADIAAADKIRELLYDPNTGFMATNGKNSVDARANLMQRLDEIERTSSDGLSKAASRKVSGVISRRIMGAKQSADQHTTSQRDVWMDSASEGRMSAAGNDALFKGGDISTELGIIATEMKAMGARKGWDAAFTTAKILERQSVEIANVVDSLSVGNPIVAQEILEKNKDNMSALAYNKVKTALKPKVDLFVGRQAGAAGYTNLGDMQAVFDVGDDMLGMTEAESTEALASFFKGSGANLDPSVTAWCAAYVNGTLAASGLGGTSSNMARSFLDWGVSVDAPERGDVVVLSRGSDPNKGHVGFFAGYDDNGNILLLGGNQGDEVNISGYDKSRVLGYRRAAPDTSGETSVALERQKLMQIEDPNVRDAALAEFNGQVAASEGVRNGRLNDAQTAAMELIEGGGDIESLSLEQRNALGHERMKNIRAYKSNFDTARDAVTEPETFNKLHQMLLTNPRKVAQAIFTNEYANKLSKADMRYFIAKSTAPMTPETRRSISSMNTIWKTFAKGAGWEDGDAEMGMMQMEMSRWNEEVFKKTGQAPTDDEVNDKARSLTFEATVNGMGYNDQISGGVVSLDYSNGTFRDTSDDLTFDTVKWADIDGVRFTPSDIRDARDTMIRLSGDAKYAPTLQEVVERISLELAGR